MHPLFASLHLGCNLKMALRSRLTNLGQLINDVRPNKSCLGLYSTAKMTKCMRRPLVFMKHSFSTVAPTHHAEIDVKYEHGFATLSLPLPSRRERCQFTLLPATQTLNDLVTFLEQEDKGTDYVAVYSLVFEKFVACPYIQYICLGTKLQCQSNVECADGDRIARSTPVDVLLRRDFHIVINDQKYLTRIPPGTGSKLADNVDDDISRVKNSIAQLYSVMNIEHHQIEQERKLIEKIEQLRSDLEPYEKLKADLAKKSKTRTNAVTWVGLSMMGLQFGLLARLTWWEYSWDIMEPVTYFVGYGSAIAMFAYYILTRQEYVFPDVTDREFLLSIHRLAGKYNLDISRYNELQDKISEAEYDLRRLRDPLQLHLPVEYLKKLPAETS